MSRTGAKAWRANSIVLVAAGLLDHDIDLVAVLHLKLVRSVILLEALTIKDEAALVGRQALSGAVRIHQLLELSGPLDLEEDLSAILCLHLDVDVLRIGGCRGSCCCCVGHRSCVLVGRR